MYEKVNMDLLNAIIKKKTRKKLNELNIYLYCTLPLCMSGACLLFGLGSTRTLEQLA